MGNKRKKIKKSPACPCGEEREACETIFVFVGEDSLWEEVLEKCPNQNGAWHRNKIIERRRFIEKP